MMRARLCLAVLLTSCAVAPSTEDAATTSQAIVKGTDSDESQDAVVLVIHYDALSKDGSAGCSGTMLAPNLVLTARHCVAVTDEQAACASDGTPVAGANVMNDYDPTKIYVFAGKDRPDFISGVVNVVRGIAIVDDGAKTLCNHDVALMITEKAVPGAKIAPVRLDGGPKKSETFTAIGWGITDTTNTTAVRQQKTGVQILDVGPGMDIGPNEFLASEAACAGDSGGPALAASGAVIGSLSRGGNGSGGTGAANCDGGTNVYQASASFKDLILSAYAKAGADPWYEGQPQPSPTPPPSEDGGKKGCSTSPRTPDRDSLAWLVVVALVLFRRRA
ncbi:MAG TPA: trypsin-like serine protease [Labilithrix sp.]|jgi:hypothetical protein